jgi:hypothetical protein
LQPVAAAVPTGRPFSDVALPSNAAAFLTPKSLTPETALVWIVYACAQVADAGVKISLSRFTALVTAAQDRAA